MGHLPNDIDIYIYILWLYHYIYIMTIDNHLDNHFDNHFDNHLDNHIDNHYFHLSLYIYIYGRGRRFPERTSIRIIELEKKQCFTVVKLTFFIFFFSLLMSFNYGSIFFRPSKLKSSSDHHKLFFFGALIFSIGITRCIFCFISKIIGRGYNILCFHRYFDVMLFFIGNSQCFCIASNFPNVVSQLFFRFLYKSISTRHINHYRRHQLDQFKCYSMQQYTIVEQ